MTIVTDASLAPGGGQSHEGVTLYHGPNLISWRSVKQSLTALSSCEAVSVGYGRRHPEWNYFATELESYPKVYP
eukprot:12898186-Prorocentrum_lima.AAC.1